MRMLPEYPASTNRKSFAQRQLEASAVVRAAFGLTYRLLRSLAMDWRPIADTKQALDMSRHVEIEVNYAEIGYDSEPLQELCRGRMGIESYISPAVLAPDGRIKTPHRACMTSLPARYGKPWQVESFMSDLKRATESTLQARIAARPLAELALRPLAYAIRR